VLPLRCDLLPEPSPVSLAWSDAHAKQCRVIDLVPDVTQLIGSKSSVRQTVRHPTDVLIVAGASSSSSQYIRDRVAMVTGKTFDEVKASGVTYSKPIRGRTVLVPYTYSDYAYDLRCQWTSIGSASPQRRRTVCGMVRHDRVVRGGLSCVLR
jgi:hypothetical protein